MGKLQEIINIESYDSLFELLLDRLEKYFNIYKNSFKTMGKSDHYNLSTVDLSLKLKIVTLEENIPDEKITELKDYIVTYINSVNSTKFFCPFKLNYYIRNRFSRFDRKY